MTTVVLIEASEGGKPFVLLLLACLYLLTTQSPVLALSLLKPSGEPVASDVLSKYCQLCCACISILPKS